MKKRVLKLKHRGGDPWRLHDLTYRLTLIHQASLLNFLMKVLPANYVADRFLRPMIARFFGAKIGRFSVLRKPIFISQPRKVSIGHGVMVTPELFIDSPAQVTIGNFVSMGPRIILITGTHDVGTHFRRCGPMKSEPITIEDGCWIGAGATIGPGVTIGAGSIVSAGAVVMRSMPADSMIAGNPARVIQKLDP